MAKRGKDSEQAEDPETRGKDKGECCGTIFAAEDGQRVWAVYALLLKEGGEERNVCNGYTKRHPGWLPIWINAVTAQSISRLLF